MAMTPATSGILANLELLKYKVNLKEETFSCAKVIEIMARGRLLYERLKSLFNTPLEEIQ